MDGADDGTESRRGSARWWDDRYAAAELLWSVGANRFVEEEATALNPSTALDLACGEGRNALWLAERGWEVTAVDFSRVALDRARAAALRRSLDAEWVHADVWTWRPGRTYDLVLLAYLQLSKPDRQQALAMAADATAVGGSLLVVAHDLRNLHDGTGGPQDPDLLWTPAEVVRPGFDAVRVDTAPRPVDGAVALDTVVRLVRR